MDDALTGALPSDALGIAGTSASTKPGALGYLGADWINTRVMKVTEQATEILDRLIGGLLADGFAPFESPITPDMLMRMRPEQFAALYATLPSEEEKGALLAQMKDLKMSPRMLMPNLAPPTKPEEQLEKLAPSPADTLRFGSSV